MITTIADRLRGIVNALPDGAAVTLPVDVLRVWLASEPAKSEGPPAAVTESRPQSWREKLWTCPPETRLRVADVAEAFDRSPDWVYRATNRNRSALRGREPLPCAKLDGVLVFVASAVRRWAQASSVIVNPDI